MKEIKTSEHFVNFCNSIKTPCLVRITTEKCGKVKHLFNLLNDENVYEYLDDYIKCSDSKNGFKCEKNTFVIVGSQWEKADGTKGTDSITLEFKTVSLEKIWDL